MGTLYDEDEEIEESLTDEQAKRLTEWGGQNGHTKEEAYQDGRLSCYGDV